VWTAVEFRVLDCVIGLGVPQPTEWQRVRNQIKAAFVFARVSPWTTNRSRGIEQTLAKKSLKSNYILAGAAMPAVELDLYREAQKFFLDAQRPSKPLYMVSGSFKISS
jgi:hypothetical protein